MSNLVKDAVYGPVRKCQTATLFGKIQDPQTGALKFTPVVEHEANKWNPNALVKMSLIDIKGEQLAVPDVNMVSLKKAISSLQDDMREALKKSKTSVSKDQLGEYEKWTKEFGQDGQIR